MTQIQVLAKDKQAALVEWRDGAGQVQRSVIPIDAATQGVPEQTLAAGIPFGCAWEGLLSAAAPKLAQRLHERGIWTYADAANRIREFRAIVTEVVVASLLDAARGARNL